MSARIPDEAVWVASRTYNEFVRTRPSHPDGMHAALEAAAPYLFAPLLQSLEALRAGLIAAPEQRVAEQCIHEVKRLLEEQ